MAYLLVESAWFPQLDWSHVIGKPMRVPDRMITFEAIGSI